MKITSRHPQAGFTLIELLIAMVMLAFLAVFTSQSLQNSTRFQIKNSKNLDQDGKLRSGLSVMERDINLAFHSQDLENLMNQQVGAAQPKPSVIGQPGLQGQNQSPTKAPNWTQFWGDETKLYFTSRSNVRFNADAKESDIIVVGYEMKSCGGNLGTGATHILNCIWRIVSPVVIDPIDQNATRQGGSEQVLIENVKEFKMRYIGMGKEDWDSKWYTDSRGDNNSFDKFPVAVQIHITTEEDRNGKPREISQDTIAMVRFTNNDSAGATTTTLPQRPVK